MVGWAGGGCWFWVIPVGPCAGSGAEAVDQVPFVKYAAAAEQLLKPSSVAPGAGVESTLCHSVHRVAEGWGLLINGVGGGRG